MAERVRERETLCYDKGLPSGTWQGRSLLSQKNRFSKLLTVAGERFSFVKVLGHACSPDIVRRQRMITIPNGAQAFRLRKGRYY